MSKKLVTTAGFPKETQQPLSAVQKKFEQLSKKIEQQKIQLEEWKNTAEQAQQQVHGKLLPLSEQLNGYRATLIEQLHEASLAYKLTMREVDALDQLILNLCELSLNRHLSEAQERRIRQIFEVHAGSSFEDHQAAIEAEQELLKQQVKAEFGLNDEASFIDLEDPESVLEHFMQQQAAKQHAQQAQQHANRTRKKTAKQLKNELQQQQADALASKSLKQIYQRLIAHLHPDREPDEQERIKKTSLMQQLNDAYQTQDLMGLIQLQIQIGQQNTASLAQLADEQLHLYNLNLAKQSQQLAQDIE
ncbi:MAG: hypothetical protein EOO68_15850, partial [Moraxellaceae bacterium]